VFLLGFFVSEEKGSEAVFILEQNVEDTRGVSVVI